MKGPTRVALAVVLLLLGQAHAALADGTVVLQPFTGAKKSALHDQVEEALKAAGVSLADAEGVPSGDDQSEYAAFARKQGVSAFITGDTTMKKSGWKLVLTVRGGDGAVVDEVIITGPWLPGLKKNIDKQAADLLAPVLEKAAPPEEPEAEPAAEEAEEEPAAEPDPEAEDDEAQAAEDEPADDTDERRPSPFDVSVALRFVFRSYSYNQDINGNLRTHAARSPEVFVAAAWYPAAHFTDNFAADLGIIGDFEHNFASASSLEDDSSREFGNDLSSFSAGLRGRLRLSKHELGLSAKFGQHKFIIHNDADPNARPATGATTLTRDYLPDVKYAYLRPGLDTRLVFGQVVLSIHAGYRLVLSTGDLESDVWFPRAKSSGAVDAGASLGYLLPLDFYVCGGFDFRRFAFDMNSTPADTGTATPDPSDDRDVAGGAVDQYLTGFLAVGWRPGGDE